MQHAAISTLGLRPISPPLHLCTQHKPLPGHRDDESSGADDEDSDVAVVVRYTTQVCYVRKPSYTTSTSYIRKNLNLFICLSCIFDNFVLIEK